MSRRQRAPQKPLPPKPTASVESPFSILAGLKRKLRDRRTPEPPRKIQEHPVNPPPPDTDEMLFRVEMADVRPLRKPVRQREKNPPAPDSWSPPELPNEDLEVLRSLTELVSGRGEFDLTYTDEYLEGQIKGLPPSLMEQLRAGRIPVQEYLDLHGCTVLEAEAMVARFILDSVALGRGCVLLVHGRGQGSKDGVPILKRNLEHFLLKGVTRKYILAFTTARPVDGGLGASYILLRK